MLFSCLLAPQEENNSEDGKIKGIKKRQYSEIIWNDHRQIFSSLSGNGDTARRPRTSQIESQGQNSLNL